MASAHLIEIGGTAAGIVVLEQNGFRFCAAERPFYALEGALLRTIDHAARQRLPRKKRNGRLRPTPNEVGEFALTAFGPSSRPF